MSVSGTDDNVETCTEKVLHSGSQSVGFGTAAAAAAPGNLLEI